MAATRERLGDGETTDPPELYVRGALTTEGATFVVDLQVKDVDGVELGERRVRMERPSCNAIAEPVALVLATMIAVARPREREREAQADAIVEPDSVPASAPKAAPISEVPSARRSRRPPPTVRARTRLPMAVGASGAASFGLLPHAGFGGALRYTMTLPSTIDVVIGGEGSFETSPPVSVAGGEATFRYFDIGGLAGVLVGRSSWIELVPLIEGRAGLIIPSATGFYWGYNTPRFSGAVGAGALARIILGEALRLEVLPSFRVALTRDEFRVLAGEELVRVHRPLSVGARLTVGIAYEFR